MYMKKVPIPPLCMVDDIATISHCDSIEGIDVNVKCDTFVTSKKLEFQIKKEKCQVIHIGKDNCVSQYFVHGQPIHGVDSAIYLADNIANDAKKLI